MDKYFCYTVLVIKVPNTNYVNKQQHVLLWNNINVIKYFNTRCMIVFSYRDKNVFNDISNKLIIIYTR